MARFIIKTLSNIANPPSPRMKRDAAKMATGNYVKVPYWRGTRLFYRIVRHASLSR